MTFRKLNRFIVTLALALVPLITVQAQQNVRFSAVMEQPANEPSIKFSYGDDTEQAIAYWPAPDARADLVFIHGGCWLSAYDMTHSYALATALSASGYNVYALEYRRTGHSNGGWPTTFDDIQRAFTEVLAKRDPARPLVVMGHSAGGHLGLLLASRDIYKRHIDAVIGLAAITDINDYAHGTNSCERVTPDFMGGTPEQRPQAYQLANPSGFVPHPETVLLQGTADDIVAPRYAEKLPAATVKLVTEAGHFDWLHRNTTAFTTLLDTLEQLTND